MRLFSFGISPNAKQAEEALLDSKAIDEEHFQGYSLLVLGLLSTVLSKM